MAYGNILGYTPAPQPGAYNFQQANGSSVLLSGPPAESLKARLDASSGLAGQRVAGPGGGAPAPSVMAGSGALNDAPPPPPAPEPGPAMSVAPPPPAAPAMSVAPPTGAAPAESAPPIGPVAEGAPARAMAPPAPSAHPVFENGINTGIIQGPDGRLYENTPGVAAVTKESLQKKPGEGVAIPHSMSESTTGGFAPSQDYLDKRHALAEQKGTIIDETARVEAENAGREQQLAAQQFSQAAQMKAEEEARTAQIQAQVQKDLETKDRLSKEFGNARVDPRRIFSGQGGTARGVLAALSAGLGQAGAGLQAMGGHPTQNVALQLVNDTINRDISSQENEIKVKGEMANNALAQFQRSGLSLDQAKSALRSAQLGWVAAQNQQSAAMTKGSMVQVNAAAMHQGLASAINDADEDYRQKSLGTATKAVADQVVYPHAGSAGGLRFIGTERSMKIADQTTEATGKGIDNAQKLYHLHNPKGAAQKTQGALADNQAAQQELLRAASAGGLTVNDKGEFEGEGHSVLRDGVGSTDATKGYTNSLTGAAPLVLKALGVNRVGMSEQEAWAKQGKSASSEQNKRFLQGQFEALRAKERAIKAGGGGVTETAPAAVEPEPTE